MCSSSLSLQIVIATKITTCSKTLTDNIFTNSADKSSISGNLTCSISDHLAQFLIYPELKKKKKKQKQETIYLRNYSNDNLSNIKNEL